MEITIDSIKKLREESGAGIMECRKALQESNGDFDEALEYLRVKGMETAEQRANREASEGVVEMYSHGDGRVGVMVEVNCETDFVSRAEPFREFAHEIALHIAANDPKFVSAEDIPVSILEEERENARQFAIEEGKPEAIIDRIVEGKIKKFIDDTCLLNQPYVRNDEITIEQLLMENIAAIGEKLVIRRFERWELGELSSEDEEQEDD
jgi:elongation factor Ts